MKDYSVNKLTAAAVTITLIIVTLITFSYSAYTFSTFSAGILENNGVYLTKYSEKLSNELDSVSGSIMNLVYSDSYFQLLSLSNYPDSKKIPINYTVWELIRGFTPICGTCFLYNENTDGSFFYNGKVMSQIADFSAQRQFFSSFKKATSNIWYR